MKIKLILYVLFVLIGRTAFLADKPEDKKDLFDHEHKKLTKILKKHVSSGKVSYKNISKMQEKKQLTEYLDMLSSIDQKKYERFNKNKKLAYWINAYNAFTISLILENSLKKSKYKKLGSIKDIEGKGLFSFLNNPFKKKFIPIHIKSSKDISLDGIEHEILRKDFKEPLIHFALVCASKSCPQLYPYAYSANKLYEQLKQSARDFLQDKNKNHFDSKKNILYLSKIFDWYKEDFGGSKEKLLIYLRDYMPKEMASSINKETKVSYLEYDWSLNGH